jgi:hypothetical protein
VSLQGEVLMASYTIVRAVTEALLKILQDDFLGVLPTASVKAAPPEVAATASGQTLLLYLYQVVESPFLKNIGPRPAVQAPGSPGAQVVTLQRDPLALDLHYLLIPLSQEPNFLDTYDILGAAMKSFHDHAVFCPGALGVPSLNAEEAKLEFRLTFNPLSPADLIRLWEAVHQPYRLSVAYVVRTVQIDSALTTDTRLVSERRIVVTTGP